MLLAVLFLIVLGVAQGDEVKPNVTFNDTSGYFSVDAETLKPDVTWIAEIEPPNATNIFVVIEEIILAGNDSLTIIGNGKEKLNETKGTLDPFTFLSEGESVKLILNMSSEQYANRRFAGYYHESDCIYQVNKTSGMLATPRFYIKNDTVNCTFSLSQQPETVSKLSVTFLQFKLDKSVLHVTSDRSYNYSYNGSSIPPEIISKKELELHFILNRNDNATFTYENILEESEYVVLNSIKPNHKFMYLPSPQKVYYPAGQGCHWVIESDKNTTISFIFSEISLSNGATHITIKDGNNSLSNSLFYGSSINEKALKRSYISSSGNFLWISIEQPTMNTIVLGEATMHQNGGYRKGNGKLSVPLNSTRVVYLLEESGGENVVLSQHSGKLTSNSTISVYNDFSTDSSPIAVYNASLPRYPVVSSTSKMMVVATSFGDSANYGASYEGIKEGCYKMSTSENGEYLLTGNCNATCKWIVPPVEAMDKVISFHLHPITIGDGIITLHLLDAAQTVIASITSLKELPEFYLPSSSGFLLNSTRGSCSASSDMLHATFEKKKGCTTMKELKPGTKLEVKSPNFPDSYPFWAHCWSNVTSTKTTKNGLFLLTFTKIDLAATHCLIIRGGNSSGIIQTYNGTQDILPPDLISSNNVSVEFLAQPCNSTKKEIPNPTTSSGFHLGVLAADCGGKIAMKEGNFSTPDFPKSTNASYCIWVLEVPNKNNIINFTLSGNITRDAILEIYDGPSIRNETMKNYTASTMLLSRTNSLIFVYHRNNSSKTSSGIQVTFHSQECQSKCDNGLCLHDAWRCNGVNDCGDNTDEISCKEVPFPTTTAQPPENKSYGVSPVALGLGIPIAFILGIIATIYLPPLIRRFRSGQYHQFRDVSADA